MRECESCAIASSASAAAAAACVKNEALGETLMTGAPIPSRPRAAAAVHPRARPSGQPVDTAERCQRDQSQRHPLSIGDPAERLIAHEDRDQSAEELDGGSVERLE